MRNYKIKLSDSQLRSLGSFVYLVALTFTKDLEEFTHKLGESEVQQIFTALLHATDGITIQAGLALITRSVSQFTNQAKFAIPARATTRSNHTSPSAMATSWLLLVAATLVLVFYIG